MSNLLKTAHDNFQALPKQKIANRFIFEMEGLVFGGFAKVKNIQRKIPREAYYEGGLNSWPRMLASPQKELSQLILEKGFVKMGSLQMTFNEELVEQTHKYSPGTLLIVDEAFVPIRSFFFEQGAISEWVLTDLDASSPAIMIDRLTIQHTGLIEDTHKLADK